MHAKCFLIYSIQSIRSHQGENRRFPKGSESSNPWFSWGPCVSDSFTISKWHWENTLWVLSGRENSWGCGPVMRLVIFAFGTLVPLLLPFLHEQFPSVSPVWSVHEWWVGRKGKEINIYWESRITPYWEKSVFITTLWGNNFIPLNLRQGNTWYVGQVTIKNFLYLSSCTRSQLWHPESLILFEAWTIFSCGLWI